MAKKATNEQGLVGGQDDMIFISEDTFDNQWIIFKTQGGSRQATALFDFMFKAQAEMVAQSIARVIGGTYHGTNDPRKE